MSVDGWSMHRRIVGALGLASFFVLVSCSVEQTLPPPNCFTGGSGLIVAQSVRSATQVPCLLDLPAGWTVATVQVNEHHSVVTLDSDRAGEGAAVLRLEEACDVTAAVSAPSDLPPAERFDLIERVQPSFMALAPMPIFTTFGVLMAVMIFFSLFVALLVLPSVLLVVTRRRSGAERQHMLDLTGVASGEYDPHSRATATDAREPAL